MSQLCLWALELHIHDKLCIFCLVSVPSTPTSLCRGFLQVKREFFLSTVANFLLTGRWLFDCWSFPCFLCVGYLSDCCWDLAHTPSHSITVENFSVHVQVAVVTHTNLNNSQNWRGCLRKANHHFTFLRTDLTAHCETSRSSIRVVVFWGSSTADLQTGYWVFVRLLHLINNCLAHKLCISWLRSENTSQA